MNWLCVVQPFLVQNSFKSNCSNSELYYNVFSIVKAQLYCKVKHSNGLLLTNLYPGHTIEVIAFLYRCFVQHPHSCNYQYTCVYELENTEHPEPWHLDVGLCVVLHHTESPGFRYSSPYFPTLPTCLILIVGFVGHTPTPLITTGF